MSEEKAELASGTQLLDRAVTILKYLGEAGEQGAKAVAIAEAARLKPSTAHRIIGALERHGLIERERSTKRYRLSLSLFSLGAAAADGTGLRRLCRPALLRLAAATGDTVFLMARSGFHTICVDRQEGGDTLYSLTGHVGGQIPLGVGPASQAILAFLPPDEAAVVLEHNAELYPRFNQLTAEEVGAGLPAIRAKGYALDTGRLVAGISALAVPILPQGRDVTAAISINTTSAQLPPERIENLLALLRQEVSAIESAVNPLDFATRAALTRG